MKWKISNENFVSLGLTGTKKGKSKIDEKTNLYGLFCLLQVYWKKIKKKSHDGPKSIKFLQEILLAPTLFAIGPYLGLNWPFYPIIQKSLPLKNLQPYPVPTFLLSPNLLLLPLCSPPLPQPKHPNLTSEPNPSLPFSPSSQTQPFHSSLLLRIPLCNTSNFSYIVNKITISLYISL